MKSDHYSYADQAEALSLLSVLIPNYANIPANSKFKNFLNNVVNHEVPYLFSEDIEEVVWKGSSLYVQPEKGISSGIVIANQPSAIFGLNSTFNTVLAGDAQIEELRKLVAQFFQTRKIVHPRNASPTSLYKSFEEYTAVNEEKHISLWACVALKYLSKNPSRLGKEIELDELDSLRNGRLDVCVIDEARLLMVEAKVSVAEAVRDNRFIVRVPSYQRETKRIIAENEHAAESMVIVMVGGSENALFGPEHPDHAADQYRIGHDFLQKCQNLHIKFMTANFLWCCLMKSYVTGKKISWHDDIWQLLEDDEILGLTSAGAITNDLTVRALDL